MTTLSMQQRPSWKDEAPIVEKGGDWKSEAPVVGASNTATDADISDFLQGKRADVPNIGSGLPKERVDSVMRQFSQRPEQRLQAARSSFSQKNVRDLGVLQSALDAPSMGLTARLAGALGMNRAQVQKSIDQSVDEHPVAHVLGAVAGGPAGAESFGGRLLVGGLQGGVTALAKASDGNGLRDAGVGTGLGIAGTAAAEGVLRGGGKLVSPLLKRLAQSQALRALNPLKRDVTMLANQGIETKVADDLLESGVMRPGANSADIARRVAPELEARGAAVGSSRDAVDARAGGDVVKHSDLADGLEKLADEYGAKPVPEMQSIANDLRARAALLRKQPVGPLSLTSAEENIKKPLDIYAEKAARTVGQAPDKLEAMAQARRVIKGGNEDAAKAVDPELGQKFIDAKQKYGTMAAVANILERNNPRALANRGLSPSDYGFGIATGQGYRPPASAAGEEPGEKAVSTITGMLAAALHNQVRERGNSTLAHAANLGSKAAGLAGTGLLTAPLQRAATAIESSEGALNKAPAPISPEYKRVIEEWLAQREASK